MAAVSRLPVILFALLCYLAVPASASASKKPERCAPSGSVETTIEAIQTKYEDWAGKCVRLRGIRFGRRLYVSRDAMLDEVEINGDPARRSLVLYPERSDLRGQAQWVTVTGRVGSCRTANEIVSGLQEQEPNSIIMVSGYCHTSLEHYVRPEQIEIQGRKRVVRFTEAELPPAKRWLIEIPGSVIVPQAHLEAARHLVAAIGQQDENEYLHLTRPISREIRHRHDVEGARLELADNQLVAQFQLLRDLKRHQEKVFIDRRELEDSSEGDPRVARQLTVCWCKSRSCQGRWPTGAFDTDNDPSRPYLCVETGDWLLGPGQGYVVQAEAMPSASSPYYPSKVRGLAEPASASGSAP